MSVVVVTDSAAALPPDLAARHGIEVVPMYLTIDGDSFREGERDVDVLAVAERVKTSGPTPLDFRAAVERRQTGEGVLVCTIAATMSGTHEAAVLGAREAGGGPVRVLDTRTAAGAEALVVLAAAEAAAAGASLDDVEAAARRATEEVRLVATVPNLDHLVRSGRVPGIAGWAGRRLGISPLFEFRDGKARPLRPARSAKAAHERILSQWRRSRVEGARLHVAALHSRAEETARGLLAQVEEQHGEPIERAFVGEFGLVMVVHAGPGLVGLAWRWVPAG